MTIGTGREWEDGKKRGKKYRRVGPNTAGLPSLLAALNAKLQLQLKLSTLKTCPTKRGTPGRPAIHYRGHKRLLLTLRAQLAALQTGAGQETRQRAQQAAPLYRQGVRQEALQ
jgi:hypothetical protein